MRTVSHYRLNKLSSRRSTEFIFITIPNVSDKPTQEVSPLPKMDDTIWDCGVDVVKILQEYIDSAP